MNLHPISVLSIEHSTAKLILTSCPGTKNVSLENSLLQLKEHGASAVITLMYEDELKGLSLTQIGNTVKSLGMSWFHLPIEDQQVPGVIFNELWQAAGLAIHRLLENHKSIAIHCKEGTDRTGLVATQIMLERGEALDKVIKRIQKIIPNVFKLTIHQQYIEQKFIDH